MDREMYHGCRVIWAHLLKYISANYEDVNSIQFATHSDANTLKVGDNFTVAFGSDPKREYKFRMTDKEKKDILRVFVKPANVTLLNSILIPYSIASKLSEYHNLPMVTTSGANGANVTVGLQGEEAKKYLKEHRMSSETSKLLGRYPVVHLPEVYILGHTSDNMTDAILYKDGSMLLVKYDTAGKRVESVLVKLTEVSDMYLVEDDNTDNAKYLSEVHARLRGAENGCELVKGGLGRGIPVNTEGFTYTVKGVSSGKVLPLCGDNTLIAALRRVGAERYVEAFNKVEDKTKPRIASKKKTSKGSAKTSKRTRATAEAVKQGKAILGEKSGEAY